jgi:hypothetical protein
LARRPAAAAVRVPQWELGLMQEPARRLAVAAKVLGLALQPAEAAVPGQRWAREAAQAKARAQESEPPPVPAEAPRAWLPEQAWVP